jgi:allantoicase
MFFGHRHNLIMPGRAVNMSDGWKKRRRGPGYDWVIIKLGAPGHIRRLEVDTSYFKEIIRKAVHSTPPARSVLQTNSLPISHVLEDGAGAYETTGTHAHYFAEQVLDAGVVSHVRFNIFPDGGVSRLRVWQRGRVVASVDLDLHALTGVAAECRPSGPEMLFWTTRLHS